MSQGTLHIVGAGLAGLAAAVSATAQGWRVIVHEAAPQAGGRCRSFMDPRLGCLIDNGNHLLLAANTAILGYAEVIRGRQHLKIGEPVFPFRDLSTGEAWTLRPNAGPLPWWVLSKRRRVMNSSALDYLALATLHRSPATSTVAQKTQRNRLYRRLLEPLSTAILNTEPEAASARLLGTVVRETLGQGGAACRPVFAPNGLGAAFVDPALAWLANHGAEVRLGRRLKALVQVSGRLTGLQFQDAVQELAAEDRVVLAVPPVKAARLLPRDLPKLDTRPILNAHFRLPQEAACPPLLGLVGGVAQWLFVRRDVVSVTVSAAGAWMETPSPELASLLWADVRQALQLEETRLPPWTILKERRATLAHSPEQERLRPPARTRFDTLFLAGDWIATGLPCTLEGAVRSGQAAVQLALASRKDA